jgi:hypothetical protein
MKYFKYILFIFFITVSSVVLRAANYASITEQSTDVNLFPNPIENGNVLTIVAEKDINRIEVMNIVGQIMKIENFTETSRAKLNIDEFNEGVYIIKILFVDKTSSTKRFWVK